MMKVFFRWNSMLGTLIALLMVTGCSKALQVNLPEDDVSQKVSTYSSALGKLGRLTQIYKTSAVRIQTTGVVDDTGVSQSSGGEIPFDVTEMIKSAVNRVGGKIVFVPYDPVYLKNQAALNFTTLENKTRPDIVLQGGITEYDRSLEVKGDSYDIGGDFGRGLGEWGVDAGMDNKESVSSVTLDINVMDFETMAMIPRVQAVNSIRIYKGMQEGEFGFSVFGASLGLSGSIKKIQGHHAAVRTLVELSVLEVVGKYLRLPYWKCLGGEMQPDPIVIENVKDAYFASSKTRKILMLQRLLPLYGFGNIRRTGKLDNATVTALRMYKKAYAVSSDKLNEDFYAGLFLNVPLFDEQSKVAFSAPKTLQNDNLTLASITAPPVKAKSNLLSVKLWTEAKEYKAGQKIRVFIKSNADFYGRLAYVMADGTVVQLLPNLHRQLAFFKSQRTYALPDVGDKYSLEVVPPFGSEKLVLFASAKPLPSIELAGTRQGLGVFKGSASDYSIRSRGISLVANKKQPEQTTKSAPKIISVECPITTTSN